MSERGDQQSGGSNSNGQPPGRPDGEDDADFFLEMTLQEHLEELRTRILWSSITIFLALIAAFFIVDHVLEKIAEQANVPNDRITGISPTEGFVTWFKALMYIAIAIAMPMLIYQLIAFISPGLTKREKRAVYRSLPVVTLLFIAGVAFAFFLAIPRALDFLSGFKSGIFAWDPRASELITFYLRLMLGMGIAFQLPVVMFLLSRIGVVTPQRLASVRKFAFLMVVIAAAIITPTPDPFNMMIVAVPIYVLYELGILFARIPGGRSD